MGFPLDIVYEVGGATCVSIHRVPTGGPVGAGDLAI